ncbi:helix-turn-helix transcriptional regulator [Kordiimonas gwangyangensis]|uniref:helix-turn-helix transcriptional regulator n=1 Tax=Kordiimonas gwangyangensis TaxID=288022 RepID=UPI000373737C|nr:LuxR family transcriptional regulator [Kordiimonas gwangyangensis]
MKHNLEHFEKAMAFIDASKSATSIDALSAAFQEVNTSLGFDHFACLSSVEFGAMPEGAVFLSGGASEWSDIYLEEHFGRTDRVLQISLRENMPVRWDKENPLVGLADASGEPSVLFGITVPIHMIGSFPGTVNVVGRTNEIAPEAEYAVQLMSVYLHDAALRLAKEEDKPMRPAIRLTPRERECLQWVAAGKTDWEIAAILSLSERTVHNHIEGAKSKLEATSRVQAVVKAFLRNLIY